MASTISGMPAFDPSMLSKLRDKMFAKIDADGDGSLTKTELEAAAPKDGKGPDASRMIEDFDADGDGALSKTEMDAGFKKIDDKMRSTFLQLQEEASGESEDLFAALDSDEDGSISKTELEAGKETLREAFGPPPGRGPGGPPPMNAAETEDEEGDDTTSASSSTSKVFDELDTNEDGTVSASEFAAGQDKVRDRLSSAFGPPPPPEPEDAEEASSAGGTRRQMMSFLLSLQEELQAA